MFFSIVIFILLNYDKQQYFQALLNIINAIKLIIQKKVFFSQFY
jgi:hypothetical protein